MTDQDKSIGRRGFVGGALGAAAGAGVASLLSQNQAQAQPPGGPPPGISPNFVTPVTSFKLESTIYDCDVDGEIPSDLNDVTGVTKFGEMPGGGPPGGCA